MLRPKRARADVGRSTLGPFGPEQRLWAAGLIEDIKDLAKAVRQIEAIDALVAAGRQTEELLEQREAWQEEKEYLHGWFESDKVAPRSFAWICLVLSLSKSRIRERVKKILEGDEQLIRTLRELKRRSSGRKKPQKAA